MKVNVKDRILGIASPLIHRAINMKFDMNDYVGGETHTPKILTLRSAGLPQQRGEISCSERFYTKFFWFSDFLPSSTEHIFRSIDVFFILSDMFESGLIS